MDHLFLGFDDGNDAAILDPSSPTFKARAFYAGAKRTKGPQTDAGIDGVVVAGTDIIIRSDYGIIWKMDLDGTNVKWQIRELAPNGSNLLDDADTATIIGVASDGLHFYVPLSPAVNATPGSGVVIDKVIQKRLISDGSLVSTTATLPGTDTGAFEENTAFFEGDFIYYLADGGSADPQAGLYVKYNIETQTVDSTADLINVAGGNLNHTDLAFVDTGTSLRWIIQYTNNATGGGASENIYVDVNKSTMAVTTILDNTTAITDLTTTVSTANDRIASKTAGPAVIGTKWWINDGSAVRSFNVDTLVAIDNYTIPANSAGNTFDFADAYSVSVTNNEMYVYEDGTGLAVVDLADGTPVIYELPWMWLEAGRGLRSNSLYLLDVDQYEVIGTVNVDGSPAARTVTLLDQETQTVIDDVVSSAVDGTFAVTCLSPDPKTLTAASTGSSTNYGILSYRVPTLKV